MNQISRFRAKDNEELIEYLKSKGIIRSLKIFRTMCSVDRKKFMTDFNFFNDAYVDAPQNVGHGRNMSAPHMHGIVLENLEDKLINGNKALTIRCCTGYLTTCMAILIGPNGCAVNIESIPELHKRMRKSIENHYPDLLQNEQIKLFVENDSYGYPPEAPYDVIYVGAAAEEVPQTFIDQLAVGGRLIIPIGTENTGQTLMRIDKTHEGRIEKQSLMFVRYGTLDLSEKRMEKPQDTSIDRTKFLNIIASLEGKNTLTGRESNDWEHASQFDNLKIKEQNLRRIAKPRHCARVENNNTNDTLQLPMELNCDREIITVDREPSIEFRRLENKINGLENETVNMKELLKIQIAQQNILTKFSETDGEFKIKIGKWNKQIESKIDSLGKDVKILERKLNKKISKIKSMVGEEITDGKDSAIDRVILFEDTIEIIEHKLKTLEMKIEEKNSIEMTSNNQLFEKLMENDNKQWHIIMDKLTNMEQHSLSSSKKVEQNYFSIFYIIIAVHAILVISKKLSR